MAIVLGLDLSTQSATALVLDTVKGTTVARARAAFGADFPDRGHPEGFLRGGQGGEVHADPLLWLDGLESSCCWRPIAAQSLHNFLGVEPSTENGYGITAREEIERWLAEHPGPYVRSHLAGYFLPTVR